MRKIKNNWAILLAYLSLSLCVLFWFKGEDLISAGDSRWAINSTRFFNSSLYLWSSSRAPGDIQPRQIANAFPWAFYGHVFNKIGLSSSIYQRFVYIVSFFMSGFGTYLLFKKMKASNWGSFVGGLFYMFSNYAMIVVWNPSYGISFPFYCYFPLSAYLLLKYLSSSEKIFSKDLFLGNIILFLSFFGISFNNPVFFILFIFLLIPFFIYSGSKLFKKYVLFISVFSMLSFFRLFPFFATFLSSYNAADNVSGGLINDMETQALNSLDIKTVFIGSGFWAEQGIQNEGFYYDFRNMLSSHWFMAISFFVTLASLISVTKKKNRSLGIFLLTYLIGIILISGMKEYSLFNFLTSLFYNLPFIGRAFRSVYLKLGIILVLPISIFLAFFISNLEGIARDILVVVLTICILVKGYPLLTGDVIKSPGGDLPGYSYSLPSEYVDLIFYLNTSSANGKVLSLPIPPTYNYLQQWEDGGHNGIFLLWTEVDRQFFFLGTNSSVQYLANNLSEKILGEYGVRYVLLHKDTYENIDLYKTFLSQSENLKLVKTSDYFDLYELKSELVYPEVYVKKGSKISEVSFTKESPVLYKLKVDNKSKGDLYLNQSNYSGWKAFANEDGKLKIVQKTESDGNLNIWKLDTVGDVYLLFLPQLIVILGFLISLLTFLGCIIGLCGAKY